MPSLSSSTRFFPTSTGGTSGEHARSTRAGTGDTAEPSPTACRTSTSALKPPALDARLTLAGAESVQAAEDRGDQDHRHRDESQQASVQRQAGPRHRREPAKQAGEPAQGDSAAPAGHRQAGYQQDDGQDRQQPGRQLMHPQQRCSTAPLDRVPRCGGGRGEQGIAPRQRPGPALASAAGLDGPAAVAVRAHARSSFLGGRPPWGAWPVVTRCNELRLARSPTTIAAPLAGWITAKLAGTAAPLAG